MSLDESEIFCQSQVEMSLPCWGLVRSARQTDWDSWQGKGDVRVWPNTGIITGSHTKNQKYFFIKLSRTVRNFLIYQYRQIYVSLKIKNGSLGVGREGSLLCYNLDISSRLTFSLSNPGPASSYYSSGSDRSYLIGATRSTKYV